MDHDGNGLRPQYLKVISGGLIGYPGTRVSDAPVLVINFAVSPKCQQAHFPALKFLPSPKTVWHHSVSVWWFARKRERPSDNRRANDRNIAMLDFCGKFLVNGGSSRDGTASGTRVIDGDW